jgi:hypothetical protein
MPLHLLHLYIPLSFGIKKSKCSQHSLRFIRLKLSLLQNYINRTIPLNMYGSNLEYLIDSKG